MSVPQEALQDIGMGAFWRRLSIMDWAWASIVVAGGAFALFVYGEHMGEYEIGILLAVIPSIIGLGWFWSPLRYYAVAVGAISLFAIWLYAGDYARADTNFFLKYLVSSQSAVMWMCALFAFSMVSYFASIFTRNDYLGKVGSAFAWSAVIMGVVGLAVRWRESYLINPEFGHIPVSNLYEVFVLFCSLTALIYLYYEARFKTRALGGFVMMVIVAAVGFLLWYVFEKNAHEIQPLVPALKSWWMKIHVPANFVGYGTFSLAAMIGVAQLIKHYAENPSRKAAVLSVGLLFVVSVALAVYSEYKIDPALSGAAWGASLAKGGVIALLLAGFGWALMRPRAQVAFPSFEVMDNITYKAIALGFAFFTIATILGAMWAAEAWGGYWSWDPKETWALIVWLNYAAWLHMRFTKGWRGPAMAWWSVVGLVITTFAFLGVNIFLSGLHSYGEL